jgi:tetratricopeptide (TPR) repeat protein
MSDGAFPDRVAQLRARWESDPSSRVFLQLAEEYRHQGQVKEALAVLDKGLQEHPGYLSALVAKGRCHLELREGEAARAVLERVVKQDATQMVANKLLVRAHLETGEPARARERLDLYSLLNDSDPEIAELRRQIKLMDRPKEIVPEDSPFAPAPGGTPPAAAPADDVFDLGPGPAPAARRVPGDVFPLDETAARLKAPASPVPGAVSVAPAGPDGDGDLLFPDLAPAASRQRYLASLASEGLFEIGETGPAPEPAADIAVPVPEIPEIPEPAPSFESADTSWLEEAPTPVLDLAPAALREPVTAPAAPPTPEPADLWADDDLTPLPELETAPEPEPEPVRAAEPATATLGDLYLRQGHLEEAERIYREVVEREPGNVMAQAGLARIDESRRPPEPPAAPASPPVPVPVAAPPPAAVGAAVDARRLLAGFRPGAGTGTTARKVFLLNRYLERIRGGQPDVR